MAANARTKTRLNLRSGPGTGAAVRRTLEPNVALDVLERQGDWLRVEVNGEEGWVHGGFVLLDDQGVAPGLLGGSPAPDDALTVTDLEPAQPIAPPARAVSIERQVARIWNQYGGLLGELAGRLRIDPGVAVAVLAVESGGRGFTGARMVIRFENHHFDRHWGRTNPAEFAAHYRYDPAKRWTKHEWRAATNRKWDPVHADQSSEWACFEFARALDDTAAKLSISMGLPQILGSNHTEVGYESVQQMFDAFAAGERAQIVGLFDFVQGPGRTSRKVLALQALDFDAFAAAYNGPGQAAAYGSRLRDRFAAFQRLMPAGGRRDAA